MRLLVNGLAVTFGGGRTVFGGLSGAFVDLDPEVRFVVSSGQLESLPEPIAVRAIAVPIRGSRAGRLWWEQTRLLGSARSHGADAVLGVSNIVSLRRSGAVRQAMIVQNIAPFSRAVRRMYSGAGRARIEALRGMTIASMRAADVVFTFTRSARDVVSVGAGSTPIVYASPVGFETRPDGDRRGGRGSCRGDSILVVAGVYRHKGIQDVLLALRDERLGGLGLTVCGPIVERGTLGSLLSLADRVGIRDRVTFLGDVPRERVLELLEGACCLVQPSRIESLGLPLLEAIEAGARVISTDLPSAREVCGGDADFYVPGDVSALADLISAAREAGGAEASPPGPPAATLDWHRAARTMLDALRLAIDGTGH